MSILCPCEVNIRYYKYTHSLTYLEVRVHSQRFIYQPITTRVSGLQMHDVTLCFLISQRDRGELQGRDKSKQRIRLLFGDAKLKCTCHCEMQANIRNNHHM